MYKLHGFFTQNTMKVLYVLEELKIPYEFNFINLMKGDQRSESFKKLNPVGKTPVLQIGEDSLFESGAICRYLANEGSYALYPQDKLKRAKVDQWMDFCSCHLGRWLSALFFEMHIKERGNLGAPDPKAMDQAKNFIRQNLEITNSWLEKNQYFLGDELSIADFFALAYVEQVRPCQFSIEKYPHVARWVEAVESRPSVLKAREKIKNYL